MMVHSPNERTKIAECPFDLGRPAEFPLRVDIPLMHDRPPLINRLVDQGSVGIEL